MNRSFLTHLFCIAILTDGLVFSPMAAKADNSDWYVSVDAGQSRFSGIRTYGSPIFSNSFSSTDTGYRLTTGYWFNSYFGLEAGYVHLGEVTGSYTELGSSICGIVCAQSFVANANLKAHGWLLEAVGAYPFDNHWTIFAQAGGIQAHSELSASYTPIPPYNCAFFCAPFSDTSSDLDSTYGLGVQWSFASDWAARLSWDRYTSLGHDLRIGDFNVNLTSLGIVYQF